MVQDKNGADTKLEKGVDSTPVQALASTHETKMDFTRNHKPNGIMETKQVGLASALAAAQLEMKNPRMDSTNPHFRNRYASLAAVRDAVVPLLARHGISLMQNLTTTERGIGCETILLHTSGETLRFGPLVLPATKADAQGFGSAATYARRYTLMAIAGVVGDEDDDGEGAVRSVVPAAQAPSLKKNMPKEVASAELSSLKARMNADSIPVGCVRSFLESKNSWPMGETSVDGLSDKVILRLLDQTVWEQVKYLNAEPSEIVP